MDEELRQRIEKTIHGHPVVLFMKGSKRFPQCGFSASVVQVLGEVGVAFETVNVLADPALREGIKEFSDWPTIPQLYVKGEFVGGADIVRELHQKVILPGYRFTKFKKTYLPCKRNSKKTEIYR
ncbi:MAG: Grx4 family monothiol glutaredoxin [Verrucomicrobiae bacterium]|nr:Grx4 family monothiol glutaredoxin [Verrucomicrobiae bacterium]